MMTKNEIINQLKQRLSLKLYSHVLATGEMARKLAKIYNVDEEKAYLAGILHDCAKNMSQKELLVYAHNHNISIDSIILLQPSLLHGVIGADIVMSEFGVNDSDILHAIKSHSTGLKEMSLLDKIIYLADSAEPNRDYEGVDEIRNFAFNGELDRALLESMNIKLAHVMSKKIMIHPTSIEAWNSIIGSLILKKKKTGGILIAN
ncbi:MAG: bis(5'-nucleosyl)-tetraphosphatase (symmetrical) YqeK [Candidatus Poribacteria bacterium]